MRWADRQAALAAALSDPAQPVPPGLAGPAGSDPIERLAVYRNNMAVGLIEALRASFPVVNRLVGDAFFAAMARSHALETLPTSPVLLAYGAAFPAFVAAFAPAEDLPYLGDVARLEWAWLEAYHSADHEGLALDALARTPRAHQPGLRFALHPATRWLRLGHPALAIWRLHQVAATPDFADLDYRAQEVLVARPQAEVATVELPAGGCDFLDDLAAGRTLAQAAAKARSRTPGLDLPQLFRCIVEAGAFSAIVSVPLAAARRQEPFG